ncbi:MAG: hypothetical protein Kow0080_32400 [Candidatus Promineifilaceae bacterium]
MKYALFPTAEAMLLPEMLSELVGQKITAVSLQPVTTAYGRSGSRILIVNTNQGNGPRFILKRASLAWDWLMRHTKDTLCRSVTLWQYGIFDQMPIPICPGVIACARDNEGWAILMEDFSDILLPFAPFTQAQNHFFLEAMAALHARFWQDPALKAPTVGLCKLHHLYAMFAPHTARTEIAGENNIPRRVIEGWALAETILPSDVWQILADLLNTPQPLCEALGQFPFTLVHADWRHANQGHDAAMTKLALLDWQLATAAPPIVDLARYLITNSPLLPTTKEDAVEFYRQQLANRLGTHFANEWWQPQLALGLLGSFLQDGWAVVLKASHWQVGAAHRAHWQADVAWWAEQVRKGFLELG